MLRIKNKYRLITFNLTSELKADAQKLANKSSSLVKFNIKEECYNSGKISELWKLSSKSQKGTLIPAYSACYLKKIKGGDIELDIAKDNKNIDF